MRSLEVEKQVIKDHKVTPRYSVSFILSDSSNFSRAPLRLQKGVKYPGLDTS